MRLGKARAVVHQPHFVARNIDELIVFRLQGPHVQEAVFREFIQRHQPFAVGFFGFAHGGVVVAGLIMHVELLNNRVDFLAFVGLNRFVDIPFHHLAVDKQRGVGIAAAVECGVQRPQAQLRLGHHHIARLDFAGKQIIQLVHIEHGDGGRQFAVEHDVVAVGRGVAAVR